MNEYYKGEPKLLVSVDCIVLGFEDKKLKLLVGKRKVEPEEGSYLYMEALYVRMKVLKKLQTGFYINAQESVTIISGRLVPSEISTVILVIELFLLPIAHLQM